MIFSARFAALLTALLCLPLALCQPSPGLAQTAAMPRVETVRVPGGGRVPDAVLDSKGVLHLVWGKDGSAYYARSSDGGKNFGRILKLNSGTESVTTGGERGPRLAVTKAGGVHVVWLSNQGVWTTHSLDNGKMFAPEHNVLDTKTGVDGATIAADDEGSVFVTWLDGRSPADEDNKVSSPLFLAFSTDGGETFSANQAIESDFVGRGCACCMLSSRVVGDELMIAFRTGYRDVRDIYLLHGLKFGNAFLSERVSKDNWVLDACPMSGPRFVVSKMPSAAGTKLAGTSSTKAASRLFVTWMSAGKVYWAAADLDAMQTQAASERTRAAQGLPPSALETPFFAPRIPAPEGAEGTHPTFVSDGAGHGLLVWVRGGKVLWAEYVLKGAAPAPNPVATGTAGETTGRPTAFVRPDGTFGIVP